MARRSAARRGPARRPPSPRRSIWGRLLRSLHLLILAAVLSVVDFRLHGDPWLAAGIVALPILGILLAPVLGRITARLSLGNRPVVRVLLVALPLVALVATRWSGGQPVTTALLTAAVPAVVGLSLAWVHHRHPRVLSPWARLRDRVAPRVLRSVLAGLLPPLITFWFIHGSLADIGAMVGVTPALAAPADDAVWRIAAGSGLAVVGVFLLLCPPAARPADRPARAPGRRGSPARAATAAGILLLGGSALLGAELLGAPAAVAEEYGDEVCPEGFHWVRMSANGCVQNEDTFPPNGGGLNYTMEGICHDPAYPYEIFEWREAPNGEPIPGSGGKTALAFLVACLDKAAYDAHVAAGGTSPAAQTPPVNAAWVVGGGATSAAGLLAAAAAAGWTQTGPANETLTSTRCQELTRRRNDLVARHERLAQLAGQRQGVIRLLHQAQMQGEMASAGTPGTTAADLAALGANYGPTVAGGAGSLHQVLRPGATGGLSRAAGVAASPGVGGLGAAGSAASTAWTIHSAESTREGAAVPVAERLERLTAQRWAAQVERLERYRSSLEERLLPQVATLRADVEAYNAEHAAMDVLEGWLCPATALALGPLDELLADAPPDGYESAQPLTSDAPPDAGHVRPDFVRATQGSCETYAADLARYRGHEETVRAIVQQLDDEARTWGQRMFDAAASARPVALELQRLAAAYHLNLNSVAAAGGVTTATSGYAALTAVTGWPAVAMAAGALLVSLMSDLAFAPSPADAARLGQLQALARFHDARYRYAKAEWDQRAYDRRKAWQQITDMHLELTSRHDRCIYKDWVENPAGQGPPPPPLETGHAPSTFTPTIRSMEELASW